MSTKANWNLIIPIVLGATFLILWIGLGGYGDKFWSHASYEACAVASLRALHQANASYAHDNLNHEYAVSLIDLVGHKKESLAGTPGCNAETLAAKNPKGGYKFSYRLTNPPGDGTSSGYETTADPLSSGRTGVRHFL